MQFQAFLAFTPYEYDMNNSDYNPRVKVERKWFQGGSSKGQYIPLKLKAEESIKAALGSDPKKKEQKEWIVMEIVLGPNDFLSFWKDQKVHWANSMDAYEWWGDLDIVALTNANCVVWHQATI